MSDDGSSKSSKKPRKDYTIFIGNLPYSFTEKDVRNIFKNIKTLGHIYLPRDRKDHIRGFGFVSFGTESDAVKAMKLHDNTVHLNKRIRCRWGNETNIENPEESKEFFDSDDESRNRPKRRKRRKSRDYSSDYSDSDSDRDSKERDKKDSKKQNDGLIDQLLKAAKVGTETQLVDKILSNSNLSQLFYQKMFSPMMFANPLQMSPGAFQYSQMVAQPQPMIQQPVLPIPGMSTSIQNPMPSYNPNPISQMPNPNPTPMLMAPLPDNTAGMYSMQ